MTYYRGVERCVSERHPRLSSGGDGGAGQSIEAAARSRAMGAGIVVHACRTGQAADGGPSTATVANYPRTRSASESTVAAAGMLTSGGVNPAFLNACREGDDNRLRQLMTSRTLTPDMVNCKDKTGKTGFNLLCANGNLSQLQLISTIPSVDVNEGDNEGNTPLHFAAQAGHVEILHFLINQFKQLEIDARNHLGFTALMKAALQGRTKCVKLLLAAGASSVLRDHGRGLCAYEWARFCSRPACAEVIEKFMKSCNHSPSTLRKQLKDLEKWNSEPNLQFFADSKDSWLKQKLKRALFNKQSASAASADSSRRSHADNYSVVANLTNVALCASSPIVPSTNITTAAATANRGTNAAASGDAAAKQQIPKVQVTDFNSTSNRNAFNYN